MIASLPMYDWPEVADATRAFWQALKLEIDEAGFETPNLLDHEELPCVQWLNDDLLFSQTCGYPFATKLVGKVHLLGTPIYDVEGCEGASYSSVILTHKDIEAKSPKALRSLAYNSLDSLSGYRCLKPVVGDPQEHFAELVQSGSHRQSLKLVASGEAESAVIDAVCWDLAKRFETEAVANLNVIGWTPLLPSLPYITAGVRSEGDVVGLRGCVQRTIELNASSEWAKTLRLKGVQLLEKEAYVSLADL